MKTKTGAITFKDEKSGNTVSLQSSEVKQISKEEFQAGVYAAAAPVKVTPAPAAALGTGSCSSTSRRGSG